MTATAAAETGNLIAFPRADLRGTLGAALKHHRLPEMLAASLVREAVRFPDISAQAALAFALDQRMAPQPIDIEQAHAILLVGLDGAGKSAVAAKIQYAARLAGRTCELARVEGALARLRDCAGPADTLTVMEASDINPLNARAASAFSALGDTPGVESIGVVSALNDAEDVADMVAAFRFRRVIVTNLDRTRRLGAVLAAITGGARLAHVTYGARPEDALETLAPGTLSSLLLGLPVH